MASFNFMDWETRGPDLNEIGAINYSLDERTEILLLSWAIDDGPVCLWCPDLSQRLDPEVWAYVVGRMHCWGECPEEVIEFCKRDDGYNVAWNMPFDRTIWQQIATPEHGFPEIVIEQTLDAMAQAAAANLPGKLDLAGRALRIGSKTLGGTAVMRRFADIASPLPGSPEDIAAQMAIGWTRERAIETALALWALYLDYSDQDTDLLCGVWRVCRPLDAEEWQDFWVSERINDRGMQVDLDVCRGAILYRVEEQEFVASECARLTNGVIASPTVTQQINKWLYAQLPEELGMSMIKEIDLETHLPTKLTAAKPVLTRLLEDIYVSDAPPADEVVEFIELLQHGRSSSAVKYEKMLNQAVDGRLCSSYVFNGAGQTGRYSSRGVQIHNLPRDKVPNELDVLDMIAARVPIERLRSLPLGKKKEDLERAAGGTTSVNALLARLIRPTFTAPDGKLYVWGDWSAIEARITPWLADTRQAEEAVLTPFRQSDADPSRPDVYILNAAAIFDVDADDLWARYLDGDIEANAMRQAGKVAVLSLGFLGGQGALGMMARGYGLRLTPEDRKRIVEGWRARNTWARKFGIKCEEAAFAAINNPLKLYKAGRLAYQYLPDLMAGTLICVLPDGRPIVYPMSKIQLVERFGREQYAITYHSDMGRRSLWNGLQVENGTQATAASILRATLKILDVEEPGIVVGHTHDEVIGEIENTMASGFATRLEATMVRGFDWSDGLPLAAEVKTDWYYRK